MWGAFAHFRTGLQVDHERPATCMGLKAGVRRRSDRASRTSSIRRVPEPPPPRIWLPTSVRHSRVAAVDAELGQHQVSLVGGNSIWLTPGGVLGLGDARQCRALGRDGGDFGGDGFGLAARSGRRPGRSPRCRRRGPSGGRPAAVRPRCRNGFSVPSLGCAWDARHTGARTATGRPACRGSASGVRNRPGLVLDARQGVGGKVGWPTTCSNSASAGSRCSARSGCAGWPPPCRGRRRCRTRRPGFQKPGGDGGDVHARPPLVEHGIGQGWPGRARRPGCCRRRRSGAGRTSAVRVPRQEQHGAPSAVCQRWMSRVRLLGAWPSSAARPLGDAATASVVGWPARCAWRWMSRQLDGTSSPGSGRGQRRP